MASLIARSLRFYECLRIIYRSFNIKETHAGVYSHPCANTQFDFEIANFYLKAKSRGQMRKLSTSLSKLDMVACMYDPDTNKEVNMFFKQN
jgi:hypothetical protein